MFEDFNWVWDNQQESRYRLWRKAVHNILRSFPEKKLVIVEVGCGIRVPTLRVQNEGYVDGFPNQVKLIRINPDHPLCVSKIWHNNEKIQQRSVSIRATGAVALRGIHEELQKMGWLKKE